MSTIIDSAVNWAVSIANDNSHGYSQTVRWGPSYDCSSFVISAFEQAGVDVKSAGASYTGNMYSAFLRKGFSDITSQVSLASGSGLEAGDVLLNDASHTALYIGSGRLVHARSSEGTTDTADNSGNEIRTQNYFNYPWTHVLRYGLSNNLTNLSNSSTASSSSSTIFNTTSTDTYTVVAGDTLWGIAARKLGNGARYKELMTWNGLTSTAIYAGQTLKLSAGTTSSTATTATSTASSDGSYTVKSGDTLWGIAVKQLGNGTRWKEIKTLNNLTSDVIHPGQVLKLP